jgi:hypothetical protein
VLDVVRGQHVDELGEAGLVLEHGGDVVKQNAGLGKVGHRAHTPPISFVARILVGDEVLLLGARSYPRSSQRTGKGSQDVV